MANHLSVYPKSNSVKGVVLNPRGLDREEPLRAEIKYAVPTKDPSCWQDELEFIAAGPAEGGDGARIDDLRIELRNRLTSPRRAEI